MKNDDELKDAPGLRGMKRENPFTVPDGYFDTLSSRIQDQINAPQPKSIWEKLLLPLQRPAFAYATITIVMFICAGVYFSQKKNDVATPQVAEINITADDIYNSGIIYEYDEITLTELLAANINTKQSSTELEDYLIDSNTDESDLINEL